MKKLRLLLDFKSETQPTNGLVLLSDDSLKFKLFPYAKIECARFKGTNTEVFIDQKTLDGNLLEQIEQAYKFVLRHINRGATVEGVYTQKKWEYPIKAIREAIRNAVVHRDYSLLGKDIKIAIYDDMVEITNPGKLLPSIEFDKMEARQSDIRNKVIAPLFKHLGIIDQWGNGLKLIYDELQKYSDIDFKWSEIGLQFQVQFIKTNYKADNKDVVHCNQNITELSSNKDKLKSKMQLSRKKITTKSRLSRKQVVKVLNYCLKAQKKQIF